MFIRAGLVAATVALLAGSVAGCGAADPDQGRIGVVAGFYPLAWAAEKVGGVDVRVSDLTVPGVEPHDLSLSVRQTAEVSRADLVIYEKGFQPAVDATIVNNTKHGWDVSDVVALQQTAAGPDPHFWQDPLRMASYVEELAGRLTRIDPDHGAAYRSRAVALVGELRTLDTEYRTGLSYCQVHTIVVSHNAFDYLSKYGIEVKAIAGLTPDTEPSAKHLRELQQLIRTDHVTTVFSEVLASSKLSDALAHDLGIASEVLDPIEGVGKDAAAGTDYLSIMRSNLVKLRKANRCR